MRSHRVLATVCCLLLIGGVVPHAVADNEMGVLILAHGGSEQWNRVVEQTVAQAQLAHPTQLVFGMGMHAHEVQALQRAVDQLERQGATRIIAVPLLVSSASEVMRQLQYLLGLRDEGPWRDVKPVTRRASLLMAGTLFDDPTVIAYVLQERAMELSQNAPEETVLLIAHGPNEEQENQQWLRVMASLAEHIRQHGGFRAVIPVTMRDDAPKPIQAAATRRMRELVRQHSRQGRVLVVPVLLAPGGIEAKIPQRLKGLSYLYNGKTLLPHPRLAQWIGQQVERISAASVADVSQAPAMPQESSCAPCAARARGLPAPPEDAAAPAQ